MLFRVVLYAEGGGETAGTLMLPPAPGNPLAEEALGPGHLLVRRILAERGGVPGEAVRFESPLRARGRVARGSDLLDRHRLRELLTWAQPSRQPDLAVVLVDRDGDAARKNTLEANTEGLTVQRLIGVATEEFESWLIGDLRVLADVLGADLASPPPPESMAPGEAKQFLRTCIRNRAAAPSERQVRREVASRCDLEQLERNLRSFESFVRDLRRARLRG